jgi:hypothetical protein
MGLKGVFGLSGSMLVAWVIKVKVECDFLGDAKRELRINSFF